MKNMKNDENHEKMGFLAIFQSFVPLSKAHCFLQDFEKKGPKYPPFFDDFDRA
jgi:hypothetical protein